MNFNKNKSDLYLLLVIFFAIFASILVGKTSPEHPTIIALFPPIIAIAAAFLLRQVIVALFLGIWFGAWIVNGSGAGGVFVGLVDVVDKYAVTALSNHDHIMIILTSLFIGGMMGVVSANGGMMGVVELILKWAKSKKQVQLSATFMGFFIFFDDYANSLITGNTMRPLTDKKRISREKLAYIVDSTAAPVASVAVISLWIAYQVSLIKSATQAIDGLPAPYSMFLHSLAYSFYPMLALLFVFMVILTARDFGPMLKAERRAAKGDVTGNARAQGLNTDKVTCSSALNAIVPTAVLMLTVVLGIFITGEGNTLQEIVGSSNSLLALTLGGFFGAIVAIVISLVNSPLSLDDIFDAWLAGLNTVSGAIVVLVLSWSLAQVTKDLNTASYLVSLLGDSIPAELLPTTVFILSAIIALGTGTSWGTMAILMPLVIPLCWQLLSINSGVVAPTDMHLLYSSIAAVLTGAVWGDHCSPISDTTILSSMASQCHHVDHVRTQMPYALLVGVVAILIAALPVGFGMPWWIGYLLAAMSLLLILRYFGDKI